MTSHLNFGQAPSVDRYDHSMTPPRRPLPSVSQIESAILTLQNDPKSVSLSDLENIMTLVYLPEHFRVLTGRIVPSCIAILKQSGKRVFDNQAGVLALQILCLSVAAAVIVRNDRLDRFLASLELEREKGLLPPVRVDVSMHLVGWIGTIMQDIVKAGNQEIAHGLAALHGLFGWYKDSKTGNPICLEELGGFNDEHALFLIGCFWKQRKHTMKTFQDVFMPGWTLVLHIMWKHLAFLDGPVPDMNNLIGRLRELVIRYSFVCTSFEDVVLYHHYTELHCAVDHPTQLGPVDHEDLAMVVSCCVLKLTPPEGCPGSLHQIPLDYATDLLEALFFDMREMKDPEMCLPLLKAGFARLWLDLVKVPDDKGVRWIDVAPFTFQLLAIARISLLFAKTPAFRRRVVAFPIHSVLLESDFIELLGRFCLMPTLLSEIPPGVQTGETVNIPYKQWTDLEDVSKFIDALPELPKSAIDSVFGSHGSEWLKILRAMRLLKARLHPKHPLLRWVACCLSLWLKLGAACEFQLPRAQCSYSRCSGANLLSGADLMCMRCRSSCYCSPVCQRADWIQEPNPHKSYCQPPDSVGEHAWC